MMMKCKYQRSFGAYSWCSLSENVCVSDSGNPSFDIKCEAYEEELKVNKEKE